MKRLIGIMIIVFLALCGTAVAAPKNITFYLDTLAKEVSGTTCASPSGVSQMVAEGGGAYTRADGVKVISIANFIGGMGVAQLTGVSPSEASITHGGSTPWCWSGSTFYLYAAVSVNADKILEVDRIPIFHGTAISGDTVTPRPFIMPRGDFLSILWRAGSGTSLFSGATVEVILDIPDNQNWDAPKPLYLSTSVYYLNANSGTTLFSNNDSNGKAIPPGARWGLAQNSTTSGVTVLYSQGVETIVPATSKSIPADGERPFTGSLQTLKNISARALGTTTLTVEWWSAAKPY